MATVSTATTNFSDTVTDLIVGRTEDILAARYVHAGTGAGFQRATIVKGTNLLRFVAYAQLAAATTALTEGAAPTAQTLTIASDTATAAQMGWTVEITDLALLESPHDLLMVAADRIADQAANSIDVVIRDVLKAGTNVKYSNGSARSDVSATITGALVKKMFWFLVDSNVPQFGDNCFHAILSPEQAYDLETDTANGGWMDVHKYVGNSELYTGEIGKYAGVRFMVSSNAALFATAGAGSVNVYSGLFLGPDAYAIGDLQSLSARYVPPGGDHSDPLGQKAIVGAKVALGSTLLDANGARYVRLETAGTSL